MAARGRGYFALYDQSENLKNLLRKCQIILQKHSLGDTLQDSFKPWWLVRKIATRGQDCLEILFLPYGRGAILALLGLLFTFGNPNWLFLISEEKEVMTGKLEISI